MKRCILVIVAASLLLAALALPASAQIKVVANGNNLILDSPPVIKEGRTLVPLRATATAVGSEVTWSHITNTVWLIKGDIMIQLDPGSQTVFIGQLDWPHPRFGEPKFNSDIKVKTIVLDVPPQMMNNRIMVPLRFISENLGASVQWDGPTRTIFINPVNSP